MNVPELLRSLRSDLLDRRVLPVLVVLGLALAGAVAYAALAGGGSPKPAPALAAVPAPAAPGASSVTEASANPHAAVSETTEGGHYQHHAGSRNPFTPLLPPKASATSASKSAATTSTTASAGEPSSTGTSSGGGSSSSGGATPSQPSAPAPKPKPKPKPKPAYVVNLQFGLVPAAPAEPQLTPYELRARRPLPSASDPWLIFTGVHGTPFQAVFTLSREAILKGPAVCQPSTAQCETIELPAGKSEQLEYLEANGQSAVYEVKVLTIARPEGAAAARIARRHRARHHHR
jgi:hypothetical protein